MQPGWRQVLVKKRPLPSMVVSNAIVSAATSGLAGRPDTRIADNLYIVGDWVGKEGMLSNASVASAKHARSANFEWVKTIFILLRGKESTCFLLTLVGLNFVVPFSRSSSNSFSIGTHRAFRHKALIHF